MKKRNSGIIARQINYVYLRRTWLSLASLAVLVILAGCTGSGLPARGWAGSTYADGKLYIGSMDGKLVGLDAATGAKLFNDLTLETPRSGGFLSCAPATAAVAIYGTPVTANGLVYVAGYNGKVYAIDALKGVERWRYPRDISLAAIVGGLTLSTDGKIYFGTSDNKVYALNGTGGEPAWEKPFVTGNKVWGTPAVDDNTVFIGSFDKNLYALRATDGTLQWQFTTGGPIAMTPLVANGTVYFGSFDRQFYAVDKTTGALRWQTASPAGNWYWAKSIIVDNQIYAPNLDGKVYIFNLSTGQVLNDIKIGSAISSSPVLVGDNIILAEQNGKVWKLNTKSNVVTLLHDFGSKVKLFAPLAASANIAYIHTQDRTLHLVNTDTGVIARSIGIGTSQ